MKIASVSSARQSEPKASRPKQRRTRRKHRDQALPLPSFFVCLALPQLAIPDDHARGASFLRCADFARKVTLTPLDQRDLPRRRRDRVPRWQGGRYTPILWAVAVTARRRPSRLRPAGCIRDEVDRIGRRPRCALWIRGVEEGGEREEEARDGQCQRREELGREGGGSMRQSHVGVVRNLQR